MEDIKISVGFLETHFYFNDNSHSMNAYIKNKCDSAFLNIISEVLKELGFAKNITVEALPPTEGSLVEWLEFFCSPSGAVATIGSGSAVIACVLQIIALLKTTPPPIHPKDPLDTENTKLDIQKKKLEIELLKNKLLNNEINTEGFEQKNIKEDLRDETEIFKDAVYDVLINNFKIRKNLSVFYENLIIYKKVKSVGCTVYDNKLDVISSERIVKRDKFNDFILDLNEYDVIDENARIIIYSPNLVKGRHKWRGFYPKLDKVIDFSMKDIDFKRDVENGVITFKNGATIDAILVSTVRLGLDGEEASKSYAVEIVKKYTIENKPIETPQGKQHSFNRKKEQAQNILPFDYDD